MKQWRCLLFLMMIVLAPGLVLSDPETATDKPYVASLFTDNMVLQRGISDPVWGWTNPGAMITVTLAGKTAQAVAGTDGKYVAKLPPLPAGGPYTLVVSGPQTTTLTNVLVGDVWLCSGQSNMEFGIGNGLNAADEIAAASYPEIHLFVADKKTAATPQSATTGQWLPCTPDSIKRGTWNGFSAVGYFFGRNLYQNLHVPIGLIQSSWGGTPAEAWTSAPALVKMPAFKVSLNKAASQGAKIGPNDPASLYNGMIAPLIPYGIKGAIWYQGEANAGRAHQYRTLLPLMIGDWRTRFGVGDFPFLIVQLANWAPGGDSWPYLREAQFLTAQNVPDAGIVTAIDIGDTADIHPKNKQEVGRRLALVAEAKVYHEKIEYEGPVYKAMKVEGNAVQLTFDHVGGGLTAKNAQPLTGFTIAGADGNFVPADAKIVGSAVVVTAPQVPGPVSVRYDWAADPTGDLDNQAGLPAFPFRTDTLGEAPGIPLPANAGPNLAEGMTVVCSDPNTHGWDTGLTDGSWELGAPSTFATNDADAFPKTATIELEKPASVSLVALGVPPYGSTKTIVVSVSADGQKFTDVGSYVFSQRKEEKHPFPFAPVMAQYVRLTYPDHYDESVGYSPLFVFTTEAEVYAPKPAK